MGNKTNGESISGLQIGMTWSLPPEIADTATQKVSIIIFSIEVAGSLDREQFNKQVDVGKPWENHGKTWRFKLGDPVQSPFFESNYLGDEHQKHWWCKGWDHIFGIIEWEYRIWGDYCGSIWYIVHKIIRDEHMILQKHIEIHVESPLNPIKTPLIYT